MIVNSMIINAADSLFFSECIRDIKNYYLINFHKYSFPYGNIVQQAHTPSIGLVSNLQPDLDIAKVLDFEKDEEDVHNLCCRFLRELSL